VNGEVLKAFLARVPDAAKWRGKWGMLPLHVLCSNRKVSRDAIRVLILSFPGGVDYEDSSKLYPIHHLASLLEDNSEPLRAFLELAPHAAIDHLNPVGHRALDLLSRNKFAPVESYEALLETCPTALDALRLDIERGLACQTIDRVKHMLSLMDKRQGRSKKKAIIPPVQKGPDQHVNHHHYHHSPSPSAHQQEWHGDSVIKRQVVPTPEIKLPLIKKKFVNYSEEKEQELPLVKLPPMRNRVSKDEMDWKLPQKLPYAGPHKHQRHKNKRSKH